MDLHDSWLDDTWDVEDVEGFVARVGCSKLLTHIHLGNGDRAKLRSDGAGGSTWLTLTTGTEYEAAELADGEVVAYRHAAGWVVAGHGEAPVMRMRGERLVAAPSEDTSAWMVWTVDGNLRFDSSGQTIGLEPSSGQWLRAQVD